MKKRMFAVFSAFIMKITVAAVLLAMLAGTAVTAAATSAGSASPGEEFVPEKNITAAVRQAASQTTRSGKTIFVEVPVLMFHHIDPGANSPLTPKSFRKYMVDLQNAGYETVFLDDLIAFVDGKASLPEKPVVITFDDGYESNYQYAWPILKELGMKADISLIGYTVGCRVYPGTGKTITPHMTWAQASEMYRSGEARFHSHTYRMHENKYIAPTTRSGVLKNPTEPYADYVRMFRADTTEANRLIADHLYYNNRVYTYPYGLNDKLTEKILADLGFRVTITIDPGVNIIEAGNDDSLKLLKRISCDKNGLDVVQLIREQSL